MKKVFLILISLLIFSQVATEIDAAKNTSKNTPKVTKSVSKKSDPGVSYSLRRDKKAITVSFSSLGQSKNISYTLSYKTNKIQEGIIGNITPKGKTTEIQEIVFGTCSGKVCTYHKNISNAKLEVVFYLKSGKQLAKKLNIKI